MCEASKSTIKDCLKDSKYYKSLLTLICADETNEKIIENLGTASEYLRLCCEVLSAVLEIAETE